MKPATQSFYETAVLRAIGRVVESLDQALDLAALAREAAVSPLHFHRIFRGMVGETPLELHRRLRLERSAHQLAADASRSVTRIAFDAGYETHESFTRAFGEHYGLSPSAFRQQALEAKTGCARPPSPQLRARSGLHWRETATPILSKGTDTMKIEYETLPDLRLAAVHHIGPYPQIGDAFARLGKLAGEAGLFRPGALMIALYHDDPEATPPEKLSSDAGISIPPDVAVPAGTSELRVAAGRYAKTTHRGPYTTLSDTWSRFMGTWLPESGERLGPGPSFEIYRNTPMDVPPAELVTDLYVPLA